MKKLLLLVLAVVLCLSLVACGEKKEEPVNDGNEMVDIKENEIPEVEVLPEPIEEPEVEEISGEEISGEDISGEEATNEENIELEEVSGEIGD